MSEGSRWKINKISKRCPIKDCMRSFGIARSCVALWVQNLLALHASVACYL